MNVVKGFQFDLDTIKRGIPLFRMTLSSLYYDLKIRVLWGVALLPFVASLLIRLTQVPRSKVVLLDVFESIALIVFLGLFTVWLSLVIGTSLIADEKENQTLSFLLMRPISREVVILHKYLAYIVAMAVFYLIPVFGTYIVLFSYKISWLIDQIDVALGLWILTVLGSIAFGAIYLLLGVVFKRPLMIGVFVAFFWNYVPIFLGVGAEKLTLSYHLEYLFNALFRTFSADGALSSLGFIGGIILLFVVAAMVSFKQQEIL